MYPDNLSGPQRFPLISTRRLIFLVESQWSKQLLDGQCRFVDHFVLCVYGHVNIVIVTMLAY